MEAGNRKEFVSNAYKILVVALTKDNVYTQLKGVQIF